MSDMLEAIINRQAGLCIADEDEPRIDHDALRELANILDRVIDSGRIYLYGYKPEQSLYDFLVEDLIEGWNYLCISAMDSNELVGCRSGYFNGGDGSGLEIIHMRDLIDNTIIMCNSDTTSSEFDSIF